MSYSTGPRCTPLVSDGKVWTLGAEGNLFCLDAINGKVLWSHDFKADYGAKTPQWGFAGHPLLDGQRLICLAAVLAVSRWLLTRIPAKNSGVRSMPASPATARRR
jgi:hypothetical protein